LRGEHSAIIELQQPLDMREATGSDIFEVSRNLQPVAII